MVKIWGLLLPIQFICDEIIGTTKTLPTKSTLTKTIPAKSNSTDFYILTCLFFNYCSILVSTHFIKNWSKQKHLLPYQVINKAF